MYLVGTGINKMKSSFIYLYPYSKVSKKQFKDSGETAKVINIASGNIYTVETDIVMEEQMFSSLASALQFADQEFSEIRVNVNIQKYIDGEFSAGNIRDIFYGEAKAKAAEAIEEVKKPFNKVVTELKEMIGVYQDNLNDMHSKVKELEEAAYDEVQKLKAAMPSTSYKSSSYEWNEEDFAKITKLNKFLDSITH